MRPRHVLIAAFLAAATLSCGSPDEPPGPWDDWENWKISFLQKEYTQFGGPSCGKGSDLYCSTSYPDSTKLTGTLHRKGGFWVLESAYGRFSGGQEVRQDSLFLKMLQDPADQCRGFLVEFPMAFTDSMAGYFGHAESCHGTGSSGTFIGKRQ